MTNEIELRNRLIQSIQLLAADYEIQRNALPSFVHVVDEIALIFDDCALSTQQLVNAGLVNESQSAKVVEICQQLDEMSSSNSLWTLDALRDDLHWSHLRKKAQDLLALLGEQRKRPELYWLNYIA